MQRPPWKFGDRIQPSSHAIWQQRWGRYAQHLQSIDVARHIKNWRYFADDVFHDSMCDFGPFNLKSATLVMNLTNFAAIDNLPKNPRRRLKQSDFQTHLKFFGVTEVRASRVMLKSDEWYSFSELGRSRGSNTLLIITRGELVEDRLAFCPISASRNRGHSSKDCAILSNPEGDARRFVCPTQHVHLKPAARRIGSCT